MQSRSEDCQRPCDSNNLPSAGCCDSIWLPHVETPNLVAYLEDQPVRYRIHVEPGSGRVTWSTRLVGTWYAPLDFRAYPFDHQHLLMELAVADSMAPRVGLAWEHVAKLNNTAHTKGADLAGWKVRWGKGKVYDTRSCYARYDVRAPSYSVPERLGDPAPYDPISLGERHMSDNSGRGTTTPGSCGTYANVYDEARALYGPVVLVADIMIKRVATPYVLSNLLPVLIISLVVFVVFFLPCNALGERMTVVMTAFLSITALQFMFDFPPANYINALQQAVIVSYVLMLIVSLESLVVNRITTISSALNNKRLCVRKYSALLARRNTFATLIQRGLAPRPSAYLAHSKSEAVAKSAASGSSSGTSSLVADAGTADGGKPQRSIVMKHQRSYGRKGSTVRGRTAVSYSRSASTVGAAAAAAATEAPAAWQQQAQVQVYPAPALPVSSNAAEANTSGAQHLPYVPPAVTSAFGHQASAAGPSPTISGAPPLLSALPSSPFGVAATVPTTSRSPTFPPSSPTAATLTYPSPASPAGDASTTTTPLVSPFALPSTITTNSQPPRAPVHTWSLTAHIRTLRTATSRRDKANPRPTDPELACSSSSPRAPAAAAAASAGLSARYTTRFNSPAVAATCHPDSGEDAAPESAAAAAAAAADPQPGGGCSCWGGRSKTSSRCTALCVALAWLGSAVRAPGVFYQNCKADAEFALYVATRIDRWCCGVLLVLWGVCIAVLMYVSSKVGDHKLMLGDAPGNM